MPPLFKESSFEFIEGEPVPDHIDCWPKLADRNSTLWHVNAHDSFDNEVYPVVSNCDSLEEAELLVRAFKRRLEKSQSSSQIEVAEDRVFVVKPGESQSFLSSSAES